MTVRRITVRTLRGLWKERWRSFAIVATLAVGVAVFSGILSAIESIFVTQETLARETRFADLEVAFVPEDVANLPDLSGIPGVARVERRLVFPSVVHLKHGGRIAGITVFLETATPEVDALRLRAGSRFDPLSLDRAVVERALADHHGYAPGDTIRVQIGEKRYAFRVDGVAFSPEFMTTSSNADYFVPEKGALGVVFAPLHVVSDALGFAMVNDLVFTFDDGADLAAVRSEVLHRLGRLSIEKVTPREDHFSWRFLRMDLSSVRRFVPAIVLVLGALSTLLALVTFNRLVAAERRELGVLLALGYGRGELLRSYLLAGLVLGAIGSALGLAASFGLRFVFATIYSGALGLPQTILHSPPALLAGGVALGFGAALLAAAVPAVRLLYGRGRRGLPQELIRERSRAGAEGPVARRVYAALAMGPTEVRFGLRNLLRRPAFTGTMVLAMGCALAVPISYWLSVGSIQGTVRSTFERDRWDLAVDFLYPMFLEDVLDVRSVDPRAETEPYFRGSVEVGRGGAFRLSGLLGVVEGTRMKGIRLLRGPGFGARADQEIILSKDLAEKIPADVGDLVEVKVREERHPFRVAGITSDIMIGQSILRLDRAQEVLGFPGKASGLYVRHLARPQAVSERLSDLEYVGRVTNRRVMADHFLKLLEEITKLVIVSGVISVFVALLFVLTSLNIGISEQEREYATLKALGYGRGALTRVVLTEGWAQTAAASLVSIPVALALARYLTLRMSQAWFQVDVFVTPLHFAGVLVPVLALVPLWALPGLRSLVSLEIPKALSTKLVE